MNFALLGRPRQTPRGIQEEAPILHSSECTVVQLGKVGIRGAGVAVLIENKNIKFVVKYFLHSSVSAKAP